MEEARRAAGTPPDPLHGTEGRRPEPVEGLRTDGSSGAGPGPTRDNGKQAITTRRRAAWSQPGLL